MQQHKTEERDGYEYEFERIGDTDWYEVEATFGSMPWYETERGDKLWFDGFDGPHFEDETTWALYPAPDDGKYELLVRVRDGESVFEAASRLLRERDAERIAQD